MYGEDRFFVHLGVKGVIDDSIISSLKKLENCDEPIVSIDMSDPIDLGQEFFRWNWPQLWRAQCSA